MASAQLTMPPPSPLLSVFVSGVLFGSALYYSGVSSPAVMHDQFSFANNHMLRVFLTACTFSALVIHSLPIFSSISAPPPRSPSALAILPQISYSANIAGGSILGVGVALALACPGTIFPQLVDIATRAGEIGSWLALGGGIVGGAAWVVFGSMLKASASNGKSVEKENEKMEGDKETKKKQALTLDEYFGLPRQRILGAYFAIWAAVLYLSILIDNQHVYTSYYVGGYGLVRAISGGVAIAATQAGSLILTGNTLGSSAAFEEAGGWVLWWSNSVSGASNQERKKPGFRQVTFASGVVTGAFVIFLSIGAVDGRKGSMASEYMVERTGDISPIRAILGGSLLAFGGRLAGGCTSGHGLSGISTMSLASVVSVVAVFVGAYGVTSIL